MPRVAGLILAGGEGRRIGGRDKAFLTLGGEALIARAVKLLRSQVDCLAISANGNPARFDALGFPVLADKFDSREGPLAGVLAGLAWARSVAADALVTVAVDTPFFPGDLSKRLSAESQGLAVPVVASSATGPHPTFALWPVASEDAISASFRSGERQVRAVAEVLGAAMAEFPTGDGDAFFNINTLDDLRRAEAMIAAG